MTSSMAPGELQMKKVRTPLVSLETNITLEIPVQFRRFNAET